MQIAAIPVDWQGNLLFVSNFVNKEGRFFVDVKSTLNDMPLHEEEIFLTDNNQNFVITGDDGTVLYRFSVLWIEKII